METRLGNCELGYGDIRANVISHSAGRQQLREMQIYSDDIQRCYSDSMKYTVLFSHTRCYLVIQGAI